jgi:hypothetical protein
MYPYDNTWSWLALNRSMNAEQWTILKENATVNRFSVYHIKLLLLPAKI